MEARELEEEPGKPSFFFSDDTLRIYVIPALVTILIGIVLLPCVGWALIAYSIPTLYAVTVFVSFIISLASPILGSAVHYAVARTRKKIVALLTLKIPPFHLETSIVAIFVAAIMLGANLKPQPVSELPTKSPKRYAERSFGFPVEVVVMRYAPYAPDAPDAALSGGKAIETSLPGIAANVVFAIGVIIAFAVWAEKIIRKEEAAKADACATRAFAKATARLEH